MDGVESRISPVGLDQEHSRRSFLKTAAWVGAALSAAGIGGFSVALKGAEAQNLPITPAFPSYADLGPVPIVQLAYTLELLEGTFYAEGINSGLFSGNGFAEAQIAEIRDNEMAHSDALAGVLQELGATVPATPSFTFPEGVFGDQTAFLNLAATFEPVGIGAYQGAAPAFMGTPYLIPALSIHNAECRHWNAIKILQGIVPSNNVQFEQSLPLDQVLEAVAPFGVSV